MSQNGQTHFKNLDHFGTLLIEGLKTSSMISGASFILTLNISVRN